MSNEDTAFLNFLCTREFFEDLLLEADHDGSVESLKNLPKSRSNCHSKKIREYRKNWIIDAEKGEIRESDSKYIKQNPLLYWVYDVSYLWLCYGQENHLNQETTAAAALEQRILREVQQNRILFEKAANTITEFITNCQTLYNIQLDNPLRYAAQRISWCARSITRHTQYLNKYIELSNEGVDLNPTIKAAAIIVKTALILLTMRAGLLDPAPQLSVSEAKDLLVSIFKKLKQEIIQACEAFMGPQQVPAIQPPPLVELKPADLDQIIGGNASDFNLNHLNIIAEKQPLDYYELSKRIKIS